MLLYVTLETGSTTQLCALLRLHLVLLMDHALLKEIVWSVPHLARGMATGTTSSVTLQCCKVARSMCLRLLQKTTWTS